MWTKMTAVSSVDSANATLGTGNTGLQSAVGEQKNL